MYRELYILWLLDTFFVSKANTLLSKNTRSAEEIGISNENFNP